MFNFNDVKISVLFHFHIKNDAIIIHIILNVHYINLSKISSCSLVVALISFDSLWMDEIFFRKKLFFHHSRISLNNFIFFAYSSSTKVSVRFHFLFPAHCSFSMARWGVHSMLSSIYFYFDISKWWWCRHCVDKRRRIRRNEKKMKPKLIQVEERE